MSRVIIAAGIFPPDVGGPAIFSNKLASWLANHGQQVTVVCFSEEIIPETHAAFTVIRVKRGSKIISHWRYFLALWRVCQGAGVIYAQNPIAGGWQSIILGGMWGIPVAVKVTGDYAWEQAGVQYGYRDSLEQFSTALNLPVRIRIMRLLQQWVVRRADKVIVPSQYLAGIVKSWKVAEADIAVIFNAFTPVEPKVVAGLERQPLIVSVGRMVPWKQYQQLISYWPEVLVRMPEARLCLIGDGPELEAVQVKAAQVSPTIEVLGQLSHDQVLQRLATARVFVLNSTYEGLSHVLLEALNAGLIPVATAVGGNAEIITSGQNGLLVTIGDRPAMVDALVRALTDQSLAQTVNANRVASLSAFTPEVVLAQTQNVLNQVHGKH
ncbi:MAG: glycosyltransferase family 4 protein [Candidatus Komeilibacteria bacterium]